ncbi:MAG: DUF2961 domain-containing protein [Verrucomicrobiota bacterium]|nr:DUF2961 domain-containing protein [Verrucomicrobiota bacterium]
MGSLAAVGLVLSGCSAGREQGPAISLATCLRDLTNVAVFARPPIGRARLVSSYDRTGGNNDWAQWRQPGPDGLHDVVALTGPGCVRRIWMTSVPAEEWLFFLDGENEPRIRATTAQLFGGRFPFVPPTSGYVSAGFYCYLPIPFEKQLRIAVRTAPLTSESRPYYHVNWESYPSRTRVASFPAALSEAESNQVNEVCGAWKATASALREAAKSAGPLTRRELAPVGRVTWLDEAGPACLRALAIRAVPAGDVGALRKARLLRELVLTLSWDDAGAPSVEAPLGDFFCNAFHRREFASAAVGLVDGVFVSRFPMPFRRSARAEIRNDGPTPAVVETGCLLDRGPAPDDFAIRYFHANWTSSVSRGIPHCVLHAKGKGHYVGCFLSAVGMDGSWKILEGDDFIRVNGERIPSWNGTGLEDYFNGAWYYGGIFDLPLHGLIEKAAERTHQYRFHLPDPVAFDDGISVNFEFGDANRAVGYLSSVAYWYQGTPCPAGSYIPAGPARFPPPDRIEPMTVMAQLFELERIGHHQEARDRCLEFAEKFPIPALSELLRLRAAAYDEALGHPEKATPVYERTAAGDAGSAAVRQAQDLLWFRQSATNALLGGQINARHRVFLDGQPVLDGDNPLDLTVVRVGLAPGEHELAAELTPTRPDAWFSLHLRARGANIVSDASWERTATRPAAWPDTRGDSNVIWSRVNELSTADMLPRMSFWQFTPNAFVNMQSGIQLVRPWQGWSGGQERGPAYVRKRFVIPLPAAAKPGADAAVEPDPQRL